MEMPQIKHVSGPWTLKGDAYMFFMYLNAEDIQSLDKSFIYSPLEADSTFADGKLLGGLAGVQIYRYRDSPVGPYDEMMIIPGKYEYQKQLEGKDVELTTVTKKAIRISRIYVSTQATCFNGRQNWNIPKHLARFEFNDFPDGSTSIAIYPSDLDSTTPFFQTIYKPIPYIPAIPVSTGIAKYLGVDMRFVQPPLPQGNATELVGTEGWASFMPVISSAKTTLGWWDLKQGGATEEDALLGPTQTKGGKEEVWWPGLGRWRIGMKMADATIEFEVGDHWLE